MNFFIKLQAIYPNKNISFQIKNWIIEILLQLFSFNYESSVKKNLWLRATKDDKRCADFLGIAHFY